MTAVASAVEALEADGLVVFPTETVWGLGCRVDRPAAIRRIFGVKGREPDRPLQVLLASRDELDAVARVTPAARALAERFMPGPLTLVLDARPGLPDLGAPGTVGVRVPDHPVALELLAGAGPMAATSANVSGRSTPDTLDGVRAVFGDAVDVYVEGPTGGGVASTVVSLVGGAFAVLREGALPPADVKAVLEGDDQAGW